MDEADNEADHSNLDSFSNVHFKSTRLTGQGKAPATVNEGSSNSFVEAEPEALHWEPPPGRRAQHVMDDQAEEHQNAKDSSEQTSAVKPSISFIGVGQTDENGQSSVREAKLGRD